MKKVFWSLFFLLFYLLLFPVRALSDARAGLLLWYRSVLPVLFPFMLLCNLLIRFNLLERILPRICAPFRFLFGCSQYGAFAILTGFLCGFPMGAKVTRDLQKQGKISEQEAYVLYGFVNNLSPSFILSFLAADQMQLPAWGGLFLCNILGSALLYGFFSSGGLRRHHPFQSSAQPHDMPSSYRTSPFGTKTQLSASKYDVQEIFRQIDDCIYDTIQNTVRLGAYIVMFSLLSGAMLLLPVKNPLLLFFTACIEVSSGVHLIAGSSYPLYTRYLLVTMLGAFGGLSALAQTASIAAMDRRLLLHYIKSRAKITLLSAILALASILFARFCLL